MRQRVAFAVVALALCRAPVFAQEQVYTIVTNPHLLANVSETCGIVSELEAPLLKRFERDRLTPRQLKYLEDGNVLQPLRTLAGDGRLYSAVEIALVRLWLQIQGAGTVPDYAARAALAYLGPALRAELERPAPNTVLVMHGLRGELLPMSAAKRVKAAASCWIPLESPWRGVSERLRELRTVTPFIRTGRQAADADDGAVGPDVQPKATAPAKPSSLTRQLMTLQTPEAT